MKKIVLTIVLGLALCFVIAVNTISNIPNEQQSKCEHEYKVIARYGDTCDIYCPKCKYETEVSSKEWNKIQADMEYKKENKVQ